MFSMTGAPQTSTDSPQGQARSAPAPTAWPPGPTGPWQGPVRVGLVGGSGYAGLELLRLLLCHPRVQVAWVQSRSHAGQTVPSRYPSLVGLCELTYTGASPAELADQADVVFFATSPGQAAEQAPGVLEAGCAVIDLSPDFRLRDARRYPEVYGWVHPAPEWLARAAYGIPELFGAQLAATRLVANPGCYPTAVLLAVAPLVRAGLVDWSEPLTVFATSGISGAGSQPQAGYHFPEAAENVRPYGLPRHRHAPEMEQELVRLAGEGQDVRVVFIPHLVPASRGLLATCVVRPARPCTQAELVELYREHYRQDFFVRVMAPPALPQTKAVYGSNFCDVTVRVEPRAGQVVAMAALDNLVKGAAGQALQNLNRMAGWDERLGLEFAPVYP